MDEKQRLKLMLPEIGNIIDPDKCIIITRGKDQLLHCYAFVSQDFKKTLVRTALSDKGLRDQLKGICRFLTGVVDEIDRTLEGPDLSKYIPPLKL